MTDRPNFETSTWPAQWRRMFRDVAEMFTLRHQLAALEVRNDLVQFKRFVIVGVLGLVQCTAGMAVLAVLIGHWLDSWLASSTSLSDPAWGSFTLGVALMLSGTATTYRGWHRFQREFSGLRESIAEFREDVAWLREWSLLETAPTEERD